MRAQPSPVEAIFFLNLYLESANSLGFSKIRIKNFLTISVKLTLSKTEFFLFGYFFFTNYSIPTQYEACLPDCPGSELT